MSPLQNKALVLRFFDEVFNARQPHRADAFIARDAVVYSPDTLFITARENLQPLYARLYAAFPDCQITVQDITAEREIVVTRSTFSGTHHGVFNDLAPTGKSFAVLLVHWMRIVDSQILECWCLCEDLERVLSS